MGNADRTVVTLNEALVNKILGEMRGVLIKTFWTDISDESRDMLNFAINASIKKSRPANYRTIMQATARLFTEILGKYHPNTDYRIKDISGKVISFVTWGYPNPVENDLYAACDNYVGLDLSYIDLPPKLIMLDEVKKLVICKLENKRYFMVMHARKSFMVASGAFFGKASRSEGTLSESSHRLKIDISSQNLELNLNMKKNSELAVGGIVSNKTSIKLTMPNFVVDENGACHEL
jgi:hypothetical protein